MDETPTLFAALINWTPFIVWLVLTLYIAVLLRRYIHERLAFQKSLLEQFQRHTQAIERLAAQTRQP
jgi:membrane protein implicated in regulation of membrane protease activity